MQVTQNYKTITMSSDAHLHAIIAVMTQLRADRAVKRTPGDEYDKFLVDQITTGTEALAALNAATSANTAIATATVVLTRMPGALEGDMLDLVIQLLRNEMVKLRGREHGMRSSKISCDVVATKIERVNAALLFLENQK